jgi:ribonuclease D
MNSLDSLHRQRLEQAAEQRVWVDTDAQLAELCDLWRQQPLLALDTEFQRTDTFYPIPGLFQVAADGVCYLIDPLAIKDFSPFIALLTDPGVLKLLHACSEDLELFRHFLGVVPEPLFDTQLACSFAGMGLSIGYQRLLDELLGVEVSKGETRSDWLQRPLTESQTHYAALDVVYLPVIYALISERLGEKIHWVEEECRRLVAESVDKDPEGILYYQKFKQAWKLKPAELAILQALSAWREQQARARDMPRNFLLRNATVLDLVYRTPATMKELSGISEIRGRTLSKDGQTLLEIVTAARELTPQQYPPEIERPLPSSWNKKLKMLKAFIREQGESLLVAPELLVRKRELESLVRSGLNGAAFQLPPGLKGWREPIIGEQLLAQLNNAVE